MTDRTLPADGLLPVLTDNDTLLEMMEISGHIKWFDVAKGYGFIIPDTNVGDVLLHVSVLQRSGFQSALEGARIACVAKKGANGLQAVHVHSLDLSTASHPALSPPRRREDVVPTSGLERALVKWFNRLKGFGFLSRGEGTEDIFIHMEIYFMKLTINI